MVTHPSAGRILAYTIVPGVIRTLCHQGSYGQGKSGKTERVREKSGNFKILLTRPIIYALYSQFLSASGGSALVNTAGYFILQYFTMEQSLVLHLCT